jgi:ABC-type multidrug transport system fused ATPase/permease subunit
MATVIRTIPMVSVSLACFDRIQAFMLSDSFKDHRLPLNTGTIQANDSTSLSSRSSSAVEMQDLSSSQEFSVGDPLMVISDASFSWGQAESPILHNISCTIRKSNFTYIIGSVGSGKSTLLQAMLGETKPSKGSIFTGTRRIAFVGQEPWIQNLTLRQNILGAFNYDKSWYDKVIYACALEQDIMDLPARDATKAGSKGVSLSGGQKQRLALARAVYSRVPVIFLDDVFAGQDAATEEHIHRMLFSEGGLFREMGTTVVCVTNTSKFQSIISSLAYNTHMDPVHRLVYADHVIALSEQGSILHQGTFEQLKTDTAYFKGLHFEQNGSASEDDNSIPARPGELTTSSPPAPVEDTQASLGQGLGEFATYGYYLGSVPLWHVLLNASLVCLHAGGYKMTELLLSFWTGRTGATQHESNNFYLGLYGMLAGLSMAALITCVFFYLIITVPLSSEVLHARLLKSIMDAPLSFFSKTDVGVTTTRFSQDISVVDTELPFTLIDLLINIAVAFLSAVMMCVFSGYFAATLPPILFFCWRKFKVPLRFCFSNITCSSFKVLSPYVSAD